MNKPQTHAPATDSPTPAPNKPASGWRRTRLLLLAFLPVLLCPSGACAPAPKTWRAEAKILVISHPPSAPSDPLGGVPRRADDSMGTQIALLQNREMARRTAMEMKNMALMNRMNGTMGGTTSSMSDDIRGSVKATNPPGTRTLIITAEAATPTQAKDLANAVARAFVAYKKNLAARDMISAQSKLEREAARAAQALDRAERQEQQSKQAAAPLAIGATRLHENTEIARELYRRLQTALAAARLQQGLVSGDVTITQYAQTPNTRS